MSKLFILRNDLVFKTIQQNGEDQVVVIDHLQLAEDSLVFPMQMVGFLQLAVEGHSLELMREKLDLDFSLSISETKLSTIYELLNKFYLLENDYYFDNVSKTTSEYRKNKSRPQLLNNIIELTALKNLHDSVQNSGDTPEPSKIEGMILPHIDYHRGSRIYEQCLLELSAGSHDYELIIILGTDHYSGTPYPILTNLNYKTANGTYQTNTELVNQLNSAVPDIDLLEYELRHKYEHSIEIGLNILSGVLSPDSVKVLPILAGSVKSILDNSEDLIEINKDLQAFGTALKIIVDKHKCLIVAAADLCHVGPAFGGDPLNLALKYKIQEYDQQILNSIISSDSSGFLEKAFLQNNINNICGISSIYYLLQIINSSNGKIIGYAQCPADEYGTSIVSIAGVTFS